MAQSRQLFREKSSVLSKLRNRELRNAPTGASVRFTYASIPAWPQILGKSYPLTNMCLDQVTQSRKVYACIPPVHAVSALRSPTRCLLSFIYSPRILTSCVAYLSHVFRGRQLMLKDWRTTWVVLWGMESTWYAPERHSASYAEGSCYPYMLSLPRAGSCTPWVDLQVCYGYSLHDVALYRFTGLQECIHGEVDDADEATIRHDLHFSRSAFFCACSPADSSNGGARTCHSSLLALQSVMRRQAVQAAISQLRLRQPT